MAPDRFVPAWLGLEVRDSSLMFWGFDEWRW